MLAIQNTKFWRYMGMVQKIIMVLASMSILTLVLVQVALRYIFLMPLMGTEELATMVGFWLYFMGASWGTAERTHIKADLMQAVFKDPKKLIWVKLLTATIAVVLAVVMIFWGLDFFKWGLQRRQLSPTLMLPMVYSQSSIFFGATLMTFYFIIEWLDYFLQAIGKKPIETKDDSCKPVDSVAIDAAE